MFTKYSLLYFVVSVGLKINCKGMELYSQGGRCIGDCGRGSMLLPFY